MSNPAVIAGNPNTVTQLGPSSTKDGTPISQENSDVLANFIQCHGQIQKSTWKKSPLRIELGAAGLDSPSETGTAEIPSTEAFVFAAVYFRQLCPGSDHLFDHACDIFKEKTGSNVKATWIAKEQELFEKSWSTHLGMLTKTTTKDLFRAYLYGSYLIHSVPNTWKKPREAFEQLMENHPKNNLLFDLNGGLHQLYNHIINVTLVIYQDYAFWINNGYSPRPRLAWHNRLFVADNENSDDGRPSKEAT